MGGLGRVLTSDVEGIDRSLRMVWTLTVSALHFYYRKDFIVEGYA